MIQRTLLFLLFAFQGPAQSTFAFHSSFWVNLHHTLYNYAFIEKAGIVVDLSKLSPAEAAVWNEAVEYYGKPSIPRSSNGPH